MSEAPPGWRWQKHALVASTQDLAIAAARAGEKGRLAVIATQQSGGRGSRGRAWVSQAGNLNLSVLLRPAEATVEPGRWALLAGVAVYDALSTYTGGLMLKWPNDVLLHGGKLGGILIDSQVDAQGSADWVVIGIGVNLAQAPEIEGRVAASLPAPAPAPDSVATIIVAGIDHWGTHTTAEICEAWLERAHPVGTQLDVQTPQRRITGLFAGLSPSGQLLISGATSPFSSADIFLTEGLVGARGETSGVYAAPPELPPQLLPCS